MKEDLTDIICRCVDIKRAIVEEDPFDTGKRMLLNFGHTLAHTIEQYFQYNRESHGEAVAIGMYQIMRGSYGGRRAGQKESGREIKCHPAACHRRRLCISDFHRFLYEGDARKDHIIPKEELL